MRFGYPAVTALALVAWAGSVFADPAYVVKPWAELSSRDLTPLGKIVLKAGGRGWVHVESEHFIFHTMSTNGLGILVGEAEYAYQKACEQLGAAPAARAHLFIIGNPKVWGQVQRRADPSKYGLAMQLQNDLFILQETNRISHIVRIPHEVVHLRLWQLYGTRTPIWLDEGTAACLGWRIAWWYRKSMGRDIVRMQPGVDAKWLLSLDQLTAMKEYPEAMGTGLAFYRETEELVCAMGERIGFDRMAEFVKAVAGEGQPWKDFLRARFGLTDADFSSLEQTVKARSQRAVQ